MSVSLMRSDDPRPHIARLRASGMSTQTILARLTLEGWAATDVMDAIKSSTPLYASGAVSEMPTPIEAPTPSGRSWTPILASALVFAAAGFGYAAFTFYEPPAVYSISVPAYGATSSPIAYGASPSLADPDYYKRVKSQFITDRATFIDADLTSMKLRVFSDGDLALEVNILAKGKIGSWWETPVGIYKVETKEKNHFSSFGSVNMPYSLDFNGNFFIHGWPTYEDGTPVSSSYSGGCIRLSTEDAARVYELVRVGIPVLVYNSADIRDAYTYSVKGPTTSAKEYVVADIKNGTVLMYKDADGVLPIASISKLITALVVIEHFNLDRSITISNSAKLHTTIPRLKEGEQYTVHDLLILMLTESSNQAAEAFADTTGRGRFIELMNQKAIAIGMKHTSFGDASGLSAANVSTPEDMFTLLKYIYENRRFVLDITSDSLRSDAYGDTVFRRLDNFNFVKSVSNRFVGGKIGRTDEARETYAGVFMLNTETGERPIAVIALGSADVQADIRTLLRSTATLYTLR